ncbi:MAG: hypothetical protein FJ356_00365 [Thaumarchaeota archaeon]|nr:hypothetical protein [Nitrososphaerota archaeon]
MLKTQIIHNVLTNEKLQEQKKTLTIQKVFFVIISVAAVNLIANYFGEDIAVIVGNLMYIPAAGTLLVVTVIVLKRLGTSGKHGTALIALVGFSITWFCAEMTWMLDEIYFEIDPFPSTADLFYLVGYPFLLMFLISYLEPLKEGISKEVLGLAILAAVILLASSLYVVFIGDEELSNYEFALLAGYPIADAIVLVPSLLGVILFFKGKINFMWSLVFVGVISLYVADTTFLYTQLEDSYYTGHPLEMLFHFMYFLIAFGIYDYMKIFKK